MAEMDPKAQARAETVEPCPHCRWYESWHAEREKNAAALRDARRAAFEEAADLCSDVDDGVTYCAVCRYMVPDHRASCAVLEMRRRAEEG